MLNERATVFTLGAAEDLVAGAEQVAGGVLAETQKILGEGGA